MELLNKIDETIIFNEHNVRIVKSTIDNEPWFVTKDICKILNLKDVRCLLKFIPEKWKSEQILPSSGGRQITSIVNESALYKIIMKYNKHGLQKFQQVIYEEVLPTLRKKGQYNIQSILDQINEIGEEKEDLEEQQVEFVIEESDSEDVETFNIVKFIEENPISKLSSSYQNKLVNKIKKAFSTEDQKIFLASFYCYLNFKSSDFVVDLDDVWEWLGFKRKDYAKDLLLKNFEPNTNFKTLLRLQPEQKNEGGNRGGHNKEQILMTVKTFKRMCLLAGTKKSQQIHEYYINLEEIIHETVDEETSELRNLLEIKNNEIEKHKLLLQQQEIDQIIEMAKMLADNFDMKHVVYLGYIGIINDKHTYKFGFTDDIKKRMVQHIHDYGKFELIYCIECRENKKLEKRFKKHKTIQSKQFSHVFTIKNKTNDGTKTMKKVELFCLDDNFTLEDAKKILQRNKIFLDKKYDEKLEASIVNQENGAPTIVLVDDDTEEDETQEKSSIESPIVIAPPEILYEDENTRKLLNRCLPSFLTEFMYQQKNREAPKGTRWCNSFCQNFKPRTEFLTHMKFLLSRCKSCVRCENAALDKLKRGILTTEQISNNPTIVMLPDNTKECKTCLKLKSLDKFTEKRNSCKECRNKIRSKYKVFEKIVDEHILLLSNMKTIEEINKLLDTYVNDNFKTLCSKLSLGRKFNDTKQILKIKVLDYFVSKNKIRT